MPQRNVATNFTFEQQRAEINLLAQDFWSQKTTVDGAASTYLKHDGSNAFTGGTLAVPAAFTINSNSGGGTVTIAGNLDVTGTTTTVSSANLEVTDKNILIAKGSTSDAQADGAGITIDSATDITFNFVDAKDALVSSIGLEATTTLAAGGLASLQGARFAGTQTPSAGVGVEITQPDANTGNIQAYDRTNSAYKDLRIKGTGIDFYAGSTNAIVGGFHNSGIVLQSGKGITCPGNLDVDGTTDLDATNVDGALTMMAGWNLAFQNGFNNKTSAIVNAGASGKSNLQFKVDDGNGLDKRLSILNTGTVQVNKGSGIGMALVPANNTDTFQIQFDLADTTNKGYVNYDFNSNRMKFRAGGSGEVFTLSNGGAILASSGSTNGGVLDLTSTQTSDYTWRLAVGGGDNAYVKNRGFFIRDENAGATRLALEGGRVGINRTNPQRSLDIETLNNENGFCLNTIGTAPNYQFDIRDDGTVQLRVDPTGNIGIGVEPTSFGSGHRAVELHSGSTITYLSLTNSTTSSGGASNGTNLILTGNDFKIFNREATGNVIIGTNGSDRINVDKDGNTSPGADNAQTFGTSGTRWSTLYAHNASFISNNAGVSNYIDIRNTHATYGGGIRVRSNNTYGELQICNYDGSGSSSFYNSTGGWHWGSNMQFHGSVLPWTDNSHDCGSSSKRWANVYTADIQMNNTGTGGNEVDGSEGRWTMQEGADDLFLINRNTGKKYKFNLTEVS